MPRLTEDRGRTDRRPHKDVQKTTNPLATQAPTLWVMPLNQRNDPGLQMCSANNTEAEAMHSRQRKQSQSGMAQGNPLQICSEPQLSRCKRETSAAEPAEDIRACRRPVVTSKTGIESFKYEANALLIHHRIDCQTKPMAEPPIDCNNPFNYLDERPHVYQIGEHRSS